jgi:hypothetical protein
VFRKRTGSSNSSGDEQRRNSVDFKCPPKDKFYADVHKVTTIEDTLELMKQIDKVRNSLDSESSVENIRYQQGNSTNTSRPSSGKSLLGTTNSGFQDSDMQLNNTGNLRRNPLPPLTMENRADTLSLEGMNLPNCPALPPITTEPPPKQSFHIHNPSGESSDTSSTVLAPSISHHVTASNHSETQGPPPTESLHAYQPQEGTIAEEEASESSSNNKNQEKEVSSRVLRVRSQ